MHPGTVLGGRFRLEDLLHEHAGARFWRGRDTVLERSVAIHALSSDDPRAPQVAIAARASAQVNEPHLLRVLDCDESDGLTWVVNEWGDGISLDFLLERGPLSEERAVWLVREVAEFVAVAHAQGIAHGRLNPESVLLTNANSVKIIGFAVNAAFLGDETAGTGARIDDDVTDLGGLLYAALTGRWPGASRSRVPSAPSDTSGPLRPRQVRAGVPRELDELCEGVLRTVPEAPPVRTAHEVLARLSIYSGGPAAADVESTAPVMEPHEVLNTPWEPLPPPELPPPDSPFEQPEDRPLFAEPPRSTPPPELNRYDDTAAPGLPPAGNPWPFSEPDDTGSFSGDEGSGWLRLALAIAAVVSLIAAGYIGFALLRDADPALEAEEPGATPTGVPMEIESVVDFDPEGDGRENPNQARFAIDGDESTLWRTDLYQNNPRLALLKPGVGLLLDLGSEQSVGSVEVVFDGQPTEVVLRSAPEGDQPTVLADTEVIDTITAEGESAVFRLQDTSARYLLVWLTSLPDAGNGYRGAIREIMVRP